MDKVCITTLVDKKYMEFVPLFLYCANKAYPDYHIKLFFRDQCTKDLSWAKNYSSHIVFEDYHHSGWNTIALRFLVPSAFFQGFDYVYVTDIDMMLIWEKRPLHQFHLDEMKKTGLCYSNSLRNKHHWKGEESLSGLHFCHVSWFNHVKEQAEKHLKILKVIEVNREYDGHMLYCMCRDAGIGLPVKYPLVRRHHGIHLGSFRLFKDDEKLHKRITTEHKRQWRLLSESKKFIELKQQATGVAAEQLKQLDVFCGL